MADFEATQSLHQLKYVKNKFIVYFKKISLLPFTSILLVIVCAAQVENDKMKMKMAERLKLSYKSGTTTTCG